MKLLALSCLAVAVVGAGAGAVVPRLTDDGDAAPVSKPAGVVRTHLTGNATSPVLIGLRAAHPATGVTQVTGPFDDRFRFSGLRFANGHLTGALTVTSDVSEIIELQVLAGFYDRSGALIRTGTWEKHGEGDFANVDETLRFDVAAPAGAVAAALGVPVLVNE